MKTVITGLIVFIIWSALCTWYYVNHIKGSNPDDVTPVAQSANDVAPVAVEPEPEPMIESPGSFMVYHEFDRTELILDTQFDSYINRAESYEDQTETAALSVIGYADNIGSEDYNYKLGLRRAASTRNYLVRNGISEQIITISSKGESSPVATNGTESGRAQNRRTDIQVVN